MLCKPCFCLRLRQEMARSCRTISEPSASFVFTNGTLANRLEHGSGRQSRASMAALLILSLETPVTGSSAVGYPAIGYPTGRPPTLAPNAMVCSPHALASAAGVDVLRSGGSCVDAAIATSASLSVIYPHMTGIGGDAFWLIYDAASKQVRYLNGGGKAARRGSIEWFKAQGLSSIPLTGILPATLTVPGAVASWCMAHEAYGRLPLKRDLAQAVAYAQHGYPVTARLAAFMDMARTENVFNAAAKALFLPEGRVPAPGELLANRGLARVLERIGESGRDGFYGGETARALAAFAQDAGGLFDPSDFQAQQSAWGEPLRGTYRGVDIVETPAPTQGFTVLEMLNLVEPYELRKMDPLGPDLAHLLVQAKQIAFHDRDAVLADPEFVDVPVGRLISKAYAAQRRGLIRMDRALTWDEVPSYGSLNGDTVFMCVVDAEGNAAALIQSLYSLFGSGVVAGDTGILLQNRSAYFSLDPAHPNRLEAGKRPLHTLIASMPSRMASYGTWWGAWARTDSRRSTRRPMCG